jgi:hypothetical protein
VYAARTVDVSRGGMLLEFIDDRLRAPSDPAELIGFATRLMTMFPSGMDVNFGSGAVHTRAQVVRLVSSGSTASPILLGCHFDKPLEVVDCRLLGLELEGDGTPTTPAPAPEGDGAPGSLSGLRGPKDELLVFLRDGSRSWDGGTADTAVPAAAVEGLSDDDLAMVNRRRPAVSPIAGSPMSPPWADGGEVVAHLFPCASPVLGPRYRARVVSLGSRSVVVDLPVPEGEADPFGWAAGLGADARIVCLADGCVLWEALVEVHRFEIGPDECVRAVLVADRPPPEAARLAVAAATEHVAV